MKKMFLLLGVLLMLVTGCTQNSINLADITDEVTDEVASITSSMEINAISFKVKEGEDINLGYSGLNISECSISVISEWGTPMVIANSNITGAELYECYVKNTLTPGKYYLTLVTSTEKSNTIEISIVTKDGTPYISKIEEESNSVKIYGNSFIKSYTPIVMCDGKKAVLKSFSDTCIEIIKPTAGQHTITVNAGGAESNSATITIE